MAPQSVWATLAGARSMERMSAMTGPYPPVAAASFRLLRRPKLKHLLMKKPGVYRLQSNRVRGSAGINSRAARTRAQGVMTARPVLSRRSKPRWILHIAIGLIVGGA